MKRFLLCLLAFSTAGCWHVRYLAQQGVGQIRLLRARQKVADVLADPATPDEVKRRLRLATDAREFGIHVLGLRGGDAYTRYLDTGNAPIAWNVSAAPKDQLESLLIRFPITGAVPYLGYFNEDDALLEQARLDAEGFDTYVRPVAGYSTLGLTADPIYSSMLQGSDSRIVEVVLHEMLHGTLYLAGQSEWDESLATFVGIEGAAAFFASRGSAADRRQVLADALQAETDEARFAAFLAPVAASLEALYKEPITLPEKLRRRETIFDEARAEYLEAFPPKPGQKPGTFAKTRLNNAVIVAWSVYHKGTPEHRRLFELVGSDLHRFIALYKRAVDSTFDPIRYLHETR